MNHETLKRALCDNIVISFLLIVVLLFFLCLSVSFLLALAVVSSYAVGLFISEKLLNHRTALQEFLQKAKEKIGLSDYYYLEEDKIECDVCGVRKCPRHQEFSSKEPWKDVGLIDKNLDLAVESFYSQIINSFVNSWFSPLSNDEDFILCLKQNLREATAHMVIKVKRINAPVLITDKLLPLVFDHYELLHKMLRVDNIPINKLASTFVMNEHAIHPAVFNRQTEINYLRGIAKYLIPKLFTNENFNSNIFFNLIQELIACWVLLPLMDVLSDPNLINLLIIVATSPKNEILAQRRRTMFALYNERVVFLENFVRRVTEPLAPEPPLPTDEENDILKDQSKLYSFMQFLKKEGAVELLRFYLDVDHLNQELQDPELKPEKLSSLYQQSEKLLAAYQKMMDDQQSADNIDLQEAHEDAKSRLQGKWRRAFYKTSNYFELVYGSREIHKLAEHLPEPMLPLQRISTKIKGAIKMTTIDGAPLDADLPTVWDALSDSTQTDSRSGVGTVITARLRKEKGQSLDSFMATLMHSVEQGPELGEDIMLRVEEPGIPGVTPPGINNVFGNLFELKRPARTGMHTARIAPSNNVSGPSQCCVYILVKILHAPLFIVRLVLALCSVSRQTVDSLICTAIFKLICFGLKERRLAFLIRLLEEHLFIDDTPEPDAQELQKRQQLARQRLEGLRRGLGDLFDVLQSPVLNKHLVYCLFDIIVRDIFPDLDEEAVTTTTK